MQLSAAELKAFLNEKYDTYNRVSFIETDPISIPHQFTKKEDIEIAAFLAATIAWGQRVTIIKNANKLMQWMDNSPHDFLMNAGKSELKPFQKFVHRTFNGVDAVFFMQSLKNIYSNHKSLENVFCTKHTTNQTEHAIMNFRSVFFSIPYPERSTKHVSNPQQNSSAKRLCMFLRWMIRNDKRGVDFGIWKKSIPVAELMCPLDVHSGNVARKLGLLSRTQNDWKAVTELSNNLKILDPADPVKYDFALFGLGAFEGF
jgi:uncharacterized protein (TIGR02757 family)